MNIVIAGIVGVLMWSLSAVISGLSYENGYKSKNAYNNGV